MATPTVDLLPAKLNLKTTRGDTVAAPILIREDGVAADLTGRIFAVQLRRSPANTTAVDVEVDDTEAVDGILILRLDEDVTETLTGDYVWDLEQLIGDSVRTILTGTA